MGTASLLCAAAFLLAAPRQAPHQGEACGPSPVSPVGAALPRQKGPLHQAERKSHGVHSSEGKERRKLGW